MLRIKFLGLFVLQGFDTVSGISGGWLLECRVAFFNTQSLELLGSYHVVLLDEL